MLDPSITAESEVDVTSMSCVMCSNNQLSDLPAELESLHLLRELAISCNRYDLIVKLHNMTIDCC